MEHRTMSDKEVSEKDQSPKQAAQKPAASSTLPDTKTKPSKSLAKDKSPASTTKTDSDMKKATPPVSSKVSASTKTNTATIALIIASISIVASVAHYFWQQQQDATLLANINQQNQQARQANQTQLKKVLTTEFQRQLALQQKSTQQARLDSDANIQLLTTQLSQLEQKVSLRQPSDWLIHEAEYLIRVAARTMWLERDTKAAINLLRDADNRLKELNQPKFLPVRALINEDIEALALMPTLQNQEAILTLMALNKQIATLELAGVNLAEVRNETKEDLTLSEDTADWQENLAKTWHKFLNDFITVRRRTGNVEPLMTPEQQQNLKQNLSLKVQLVQWAASEQKAQVYQQTLLDIQQWLNEYFDMSLSMNQKFYQGIEQLKKRTIYYDYPSDLSSLAAIQRLLDDTNQGGKQQEKKIAKPVTKNVEQATTPAAKAAETKQVLPQQQAKNEQASGGQL